MKDEDLVRFQRRGFNDELRFGERTVLWKFENEDYMKRGDLVKFQNQD